MKKNLTICFALLVCFSIQIPAQVPTNVSISIVRAEDERRFDKTLEDLLKNQNEKIRLRAALAAGRIDDERAVPMLISLLENDTDAVRTTAAFALGEIESVKAADAILKVLKAPNTAPEIRARLTEAAGKIASANSKDPKAIELGKAILDVLEAEARKSKQDRLTVLLGLTAILRARPEKGDLVAATFLTNTDPRIRADAANTLSRIRAKNANEQLRALLLSDGDANVRANAARALGAAEDAGAFDSLLKAAVLDEDLRVRVSAIRSLGSLKDAKAADKLLERGETLLTDYKKSKFAVPVEKNELLEIATVFGRLLPNANNERAVKFLQSFREADKFCSPETEVAFAQIAPKIYVNSATFNLPKDSGFGLEFYNTAGAAYYVNAYSQGLGNFAQALGEISDNKSADQETIEKARQIINYLTAGIPAAIILSNPEVQRLDEIPKSFPEFDALKRNLLNAFPDVLRALSKLKPEKYEIKIAEFLINKPVTIATRPDDSKTYVATYEELENFKKESAYFLLNKDAIVRATAAELMGEIMQVNSAPALQTAFDYAVSEDKELNDAQLAILDAIVKQDKSTAEKVLLKALDAPDILVRRRAAQLIKQNDLTKQLPNADEKIGILKPYDAKTGTKLGQVLSADADYARAVSRKNARAILTTDKGIFTIEFTPEDAPLTVDNFIKLAKTSYFDGLAIHRVVPNFVVQDGDPRGDGNGGPGWQIRDEINTIPYERGAVGMALSGKDTGGSQWFVTHAPQPHLDGGYTVFGRVNETGMKVVDNLVRGDKIRSVKIVEGSAPQRTQRTRRKKS